MNCASTRLRSDYAKCRLWSRRYLFDELNARFEIHTEIDKGPRDSLAFVLFLFQNEHVMVKKLLHLLVGIVDAQLIEPVVLE